MLKSEHIQGLEELRTLHTHLPHVYTRSLILEEHHFVAESKWWALYKHNVLLQSQGARWCDSTTTGTIHYASDTGKPYGSLAGRVS